jgi:hypothetical protein
VLLCSFGWVFFYFLLFVVVRFLVAVVDAGQILSTYCVSASVVENRKRVVWASETQKKQHPSPSVRLVKICANAPLTYRKKNALCIRTLDQLLLFSSIIFSFCPFSRLFLPFLVRCILTNATTITFFMRWRSRAFATLVVALFYMMIIISCLLKSTKMKYIRS